MTTRALRRHHRQDYPYDAEHRPEPYDQVQQDVGASLFLGAVVLVGLMVLIVLGLI